MSGYDVLKILSNSNITPKNANEFYMAYIHGLFISSGFCLYDLVHKKLLDGVDLPSNWAQSPNIVTLRYKYINNVPDSNIQSSNIYALKFSKRSDGSLGVTVRLVGNESSPQLESTQFKNLAQLSFIVSPSSLLSLPSLYNIPLSSSLDYTNENIYDIIQSQLEPLLEPLLPCFHSSHPHNSSITLSTSPLSLNHGINTHSYTTVMDKKPQTHNNDQHNKQQIDHDNGDTSHVIPPHHNLPHSIESHKQNIIGDPKMIPPPSSHPPLSSPHQQDQNRTTNPSGLSFDPTHPVGNDVAPIRIDDRGPRNISSQPSSNHDIFQGGNLVGPDQLGRRGVSGTGYQPDYGSPQRGPSHPDIDPFGSSGGTGGPFAPGQQPPGFEHFPPGVKGPRFDPYGPFPSMGNPNRDHMRKPGPGGFGPGGIL